MVALWLPGSMHCLLEDTGWLPKDGSCATSPAGSHDQSDGCQFENGGVQFQPVKVFVPSFNFIPLMVLLHVSPAAEPTLFLPARDSSRLVELVHSWQFTRRAALPVRAPSIAS
ncbi:MAG: hypothetical protein ABS95_02620 [Verrucomicrobia bacterium SCN 57-15]|nr:MAG: hypothetical protein ABS95_02620 [Verrucomicrobia bacterium SCN 57-15]